MSDFDTLMQQHEMGEAYRRISEEMGPSAQLIAFVNYDKIDFGNVGLESLEVDIDHQLTLQDIDNSNAFELACEGLASKLDILGRAMVGGSVAANIMAAFSPVGSKAHLVKSGIAAVLGLAGSVTMLVNLKNNIWKKSTHDLVEKVFDKQFASLQDVVSKIPSGFKESDWEAFVNHAKKEQEKNNVNPNDSVLHLFVDTKLAERNKVVFEKSGWSVESLKTAAKWLQDAATKTHGVEKKIASDTSKLKAFVEKADKDNAVVTKYISQSVSIVEDLQKRVNECLRASERVIKDASRHFKEEDK